MEKSRCWSSEKVFKIEDKKKKIQLPQMIFIKQANSEY